MLGGGAPDLALVAEGDEQSAAGRRWRSAMASTGGRDAGRRAAGRHRGRAGARLPEVLLLVTTSPSCSSCPRPAPLPDAARPPPQPAAAGELSLQPVNHLHEETTIFAMSLTEELLASYKVQDIHSEAEFCDDGQKYDAADKKVQKGKRSIIPAGEWGHITI